MKKLKLGFTDTHEHLSTFFASLLANRFDVEIDNENPEYLIFGDENFGNQNLNFNKTPNENVQTESFFHFLRTAGRPVSRAAKP